MRKKHEHKPIAFFYQEIDGSYRWWRNCDGHDVFDVFESDTELYERVKAAKMIGARVFDHLPAFCDTPGCQDCARYA